MYFRVGYVDPHTTVNRKRADLKSKNVNPEGRKSNTKGFYMYKFLGKQNGFSQKFQRKSYSEIHQQNIRLHVSIVNY